jgi:NAD(P)-dependent dehydrogenase (short-subunit alcohol dehydrogenase family)
MPTISLVTGGSRGLGRNTAVSIARHGGDVILTYRAAADEARAVVSEIEAMGRKAFALQLDVADTSSFKRFASAVRDTLSKTWGRDTFDHLVNNAGQGELGSIADTTEAQFDALFNTHIKGVFFLTQGLLPLLADGGRIVNFSSGLLAGLRGLRGGEGRHRDADALYGEGIRQSRHHGQLCRPRRDRD